MRLTKTMFAVLLLSGICSADKWEYFHPELVTRCRCTVEQIDLLTRTERRDAWYAKAEADRRAGGNWQMTIGVFPATLKGRHEAEKVCSKWMDDASKRIRGAQ